MNAVEFAESEFLTNPGTGAPTAVRQARGLVVSPDGRAFVALFNSVVEYELRRDDGRLDLKAVTRYGHRSACDLHGLALRGDVLAAASTGSDSVIVWRRGTEVAQQVVPFGSPSVVQQELNFPENTPAYRPGASWRAAVVNTLHLNDVAFSSRGELFVTSLTTIWKVTETGNLRVLHHDAEANFHDCHVSRGRVRVTDGARGDLVLVDVRSRALDRVNVVRPAEWFLRGVLQRRGQLIMGVSERVQNKQLVLPLPSEPTNINEESGEFGVVSLDSKSRVPSSVTRLRLRNFDHGSVVYALTSVPPIRDARSARNVSVA